MGDWTRKYICGPCTEYYGLSDDCDELTTLREFRDSFMVKTDAGRCDICKDYATSPKAVDAINNSEHKERIYQEIYNKVILPCVELIKNGKRQEAYDCYKRMVPGLQESF